MVKARMSICKYNELSNIPAIDSGEKMISLSKSRVHFTLFTKSLPSSTGADMFLREGVIKKLQSIQDSLPNGCKLEVTYAYRSPKIQQDHFIKQLTETMKGSPSALQQEWIQSAHEMVAEPHVAGHTTGGAVDIWIKDAFGKPLDMGTSMHELSPKSRWDYNSELTENQQNNRQLLRSTMEEAGFAAYDGEWWHFSYGDKEWAALTGNPNAIYEQIDFDWKNMISKEYQSLSISKLTKLAKQKL